MYWLVSWSTTVENPTLQHINMHFELLFVVFSKWAACLFDEWPQKAVFQRTEPSYPSQVILLLNFSEHCTCYRNQNKTTKCVFVFLLAVPNSSPPRNPPPPLPSSLPPSNRISGPPRLPPRPPTSPRGPYPPPVSPSPIPAAEGRPVSGIQSAKIINDIL